MIVDIIKAIEAVYPFDKYNTTLGPGQEFKHFLPGPEYEAMEGAPPRIIAVPNYDSFDAPQMAHEITPKSYLTTWTGVLWEIWGVGVTPSDPLGWDSYSAVESMRNDLVIAMATACVGGPPPPAGRANLHGNMELLKGGWINKGTPQGGPSLNLGRGYAFQARYKIPITFPPEPTVEITSIAYTFEIEPGPEPA